MNVSRGRRNLKLTTKLWYGLPYCLYLDLEQLLLFLWFCHYDQQQLEEDLQNNVWSGPQILEHSFGHTKQEYLDMYLDIWTNANIKHPSFGVWTVLNQIISGINLPFRQQTILQGWLFLEIPWLRTGNNDFSCEIFSVAATVFMKNGWVWLSILATSAEPYRLKTSPVWILNPDMSENDTIGFWLPAHIRRHKNASDGRRFGKVKCS